MGTWFSCEDALVALNAGGYMPEHTVRTIGNEAMRDVPTPPEPEQYLSPGTSFTSGTSVDTDVWIQNYGENITLG